MNTKMGFDEDIKRSEKHCSCLLSNACCHQHYLSPRETLIGSPKRVSPENFENKSLPTTGSFSVWAAGSWFLQTASGDQKGPTESNIFLLPKVPIKPPGWKKCNRLNDSSSRQITTYESSDFNAD